MQGGGLLQLVGAESFDRVEAGEEAGAAGAVGPVVEGVVCHHLGQDEGVGKSVRVRDSCHHLGGGGQELSRRCTGGDPVADGLGDFQAPLGAVVLAGAGRIQGEPAGLA